MTDRDIERVYLEQTQRPSESQLLQVEVDDVLYRPRFLFANERTFTEERAAERVRKRPRDSPHAHSFIHLFVYTSGHNEIELMGTRHPCSEGTFLVISPGESHCISPHLPQAYSRIEINVEYVDADGQPLLLPFHELLSLLAGRELPALDYPVMLSEVQLKEFRAVCDQILDALSRTGGIEWSTPLALLTQLFIIVIGQLYTPMAEMKSGPSASLSRARQVIEDEFRTTLRVDDLASLAHMSRAHFLRRFKREFGISPIDYQRQLRMTAAKRLLLATDWGAKEIAEELGYSNVHYFTKVFSDQVGVSPIRFRKRERRMDDG